MNSKRLGAVAAAAIVAAGGTGTAIAVTKNDDRKQAEDAVIAGAAERLDVTPQRLRDALSAAQDEQLDARVKAGELTQAQADAIKARRKQSGRVLGGGPGLRGGPGGPRRSGHGFGGRRGHHRSGAIRGIAVEELAKALGTTKERLGDQLRAGRSIADIAKAQGKELAAVKADLKAAARTHVGAAVADEKLTRAQGDRILTRLDRMIENLERFAGFGRRGPGGPAGPGGPPPFPPPAP